MRRDKDIRTNYWRNRLSVALLLVYCFWMSVRSFVLQRRLNLVEAYVVQDNKRQQEHETKINAALSMASDAMHEATGKKITPPITRRR